MDSIAYFAGKRLGKRPFINNVSPNKTMEGFLTAIILFENHHESIIDQIYSIGQSSTVNINGNCIRVHPNALLWWPLKCCPR